MAAREIPELKADIEELKRNSATAVVAQYYQDPELFDVSDAVGDAAELAFAVGRMKQKRVVVCGVYFAAETIKLLCPEKEVILAHSQAQCPISSQLHRERLISYKEEHPEALIVGDLTASAAQKAVTELCVSESLAIELIRAKKQRDILYYSDVNFGAYLSSQLPQKHFEFMRCHCPILASAGLRDLELAKERWQGLKLAVNSRCRKELVEAADFSGSTADILRCCAADDEDYIIADEENVCALLRRRYPERRFCTLAPGKLVCNAMRITTLETLERALKGEFGQAIEPDGRFCEDAKRSLGELIALFKKI